MSSAAWAKQAINAAFPFGSVKQRQGTAFDFFREWARDNGIDGWPTARRVRAFFNEELRKLEAHEKEALEAALAAREQAKADEETRITIARLQSIRASLQVRDSEFHKIEIAAYDHVIRSLSRSLGPDCASEDDTGEG